jgi:hypothetical protein
MKYFLILTSLNYYNLAVNSTALQPKSGSVY